MLLLKYKKHLLVLVEQELLNLLLPKAAHLVDARALPLLQIPLQVLVLAFDVGSELRGQTLAAVLVQQLCFLSDAVVVKSCLALYLRRVFKAGDGEVEGRLYVFVHF